ncbi:MAG: carbon starvation CstA family protein, partial [bacterium]
MPLLLITLGFGACLWLGYRWYGRWVGLQFGDLAALATPAERAPDGTDRVATPAAYLFPQHVSALVAAGPIAGPIVAALLYGWLPALIGIVIGVIFIAGVHDYASLTMSLHFR